MIKAERDEVLKITSTEIKGTGKNIIMEFSALCGTIVNNMIENTEMTVDEAVHILSVAMAQGVSERTSIKDVTE